MAPQPILPSRRESAEEVPQLSGSIDSVADEEAVELTSESAPREILRPRIRRQDSCASSRSRGKERHITSGDLEKMVTSILEQKIPLSAPLPIMAMPVAVHHEKEESVAMLQRSGSTSTESPSRESDAPSLDSSQALSSPEISAVRCNTTVVRGFSPSTSLASRSIPDAHKPSSADSIPEPHSSPAPRHVQLKKQPAMFTVGESSCEDSMSDQAHSPELRKQAPQPRRKMFHVGLSSEEESSLKSALHSARPGSLLNAQKKQASFSNQLVTRSIPAAAVVDDDQSETEADYVDESAIDDDDDSSEWEDSVEDSGRSSVEDRGLFQRVDSKRNLPSRRSLITLMLERDGREKRLGNHASQSTSAIPRSRLSHQHQPPAAPLVASPNDSDEAPLMMRRGTRTTPLRSINEIPRSAAQPIVTSTSNVQQAALSPRTTRRNMLSTELTESLRRHLLWERSQKSSTANAVLKRRHTSHDVANLKQYPERVHMTRDTDVNASSWNRYINRDALNGYHSKGW